MDHIIKKFSVLFRVLLNEKKPKRTQGNTEIKPTVLLRNLCGGKKLLFLLLLVSIFLSQPAAAQELNARVIVTAQKIRGVDQSVFTKMQKAIEQFLNSRQWTDKHYAAGERIDCRFLLDLQQNIDNDVYAGSITVQSIRPVYNSSYTTTLLNYKDQDVAFRYQPFQPLVFNYNRISGNDPLVSNLTAILAYYAYTIIGLDNDSFVMNGGHAAFQKAQYIVSNAPQGKYISGWKAFDGTRNRYWLAENLLNVRYKRFHQVMYQYHRQGLDRMYDHINEGRKAIADCLNLLNAMNADNPNSMILQLFFVSKSDELAGIFSEAPVQEKLQAVNLLQKLDPVNGAKYKEDLKL